MKKKVTIVDIANKLGITPSTVSKAFSDHPRISLKTKKAVNDIALQLGYRPNSLATGLRKGKSGLIGVLVPGIHYSFFSTAIKGIEDTLSERGYSVIIAQSKDKFETEKHQLNSFLKIPVEGIIASLAVETKDYHHFKSIINNTPVVLFDRTYEDPDISNIIIDDFNGAVKAVDHLVEMGYRRIAHIGGYEHIAPFRKRIEGYKSALERHNLPVVDEMIFHCSPNKDEGAKVAEVLMSMDEPPDAIVAASDYLAFGAIKWMKSRGIKIPEQVGVVGFSNEEFAAQVSPSITTIDQFSERMGIIAAKSLVDQLKSLENGFEFVAQKLILAPKLIVRESSLKVDFN